MVGVEGYFCALSHSATHAHTHARTLGRTPLAGGSTRRRDLYLTTHNIHKTDIRAPCGIRTRNSSKRAAADPRLCKLVTTYVLYHTTW